MKSLARNSCLKNQFEKLEGNEIVTESETRSCSTTVSVPTETVVLRLWGSGKEFLFWPP